MKKKVILLILFSLTFSASYAKSLHSREREIIFTENSEGLLRFSQFSPVSAFIDDTLITISFTQLTACVSISIINIEIGGLIYSESFANPENVFIDLSGEESGEYRMKITTATSVYWGDFSVE